VHARVRLAATVTAPHTPAHPCSVRRPDARPPRASGHAHTHTKAHWAADARTLPRQLHQYTPRHGSCAARLINEYAGARKGPRRNRLFAQML